VIEGDAFRITAITPSQNTVTAGMAKDWTVNMTVENTGSSNVALNLAANNTFLRFTIGNQPSLRSTPSLTRRRWMKAARCSALAARGI
jgi:hypothetical protein